MNRNLLLVLMLVIGFVLGWAARAPSPREEVPAPPLVQETEEVATAAPPSQWPLITVKASYDAEQGRVSIDRSYHDAGIVGSADELTWELDCPECPPETTFTLTAVEQVADLARLADTVVRVFLDPALPGASRDELGLQSRGAVPPTHLFESVMLDQPVTQPWQLTGRVRDLPAGFEELWKFGVVVRAPGADANLPCERDSLCDAWDPHYYGHGGRR